MKKILFFLMSLFLVIATTVGCGDTNNNDENPWDDGDVVPSISLQIDGLDVTTATIGSQTDDAIDVEIVTNQAESTISAQIADEDALWCGVELNGATLTLTALSEYEDGDSRQCTITIMAGEGEFEVSEELTVIQYEDDSVIFEVDPTSVSLYYYLGATATVDVTTNQGEVTLSLSDETNFSATLDGSIITITALGENTSTEDEITATLTISVGEGDDALTQDVTITQAIMVDATISVDDTTIAIVNEIGAMNSTVVTTNQAESTITAEVDDETNYSVSVEGTTVTVTALTVNTTSDTRTATVTLTAGTDDNSDSTTFEITQSNAVTISLDPESVELTYELGSSAAVEVTTNQTEITATVDDQTNFSATVDGQTVTITTLTENSTDAAITTTVTITVGSGDLTSSQTVDVTQANSYFEGEC